MSDYKYDLVAFGAHPDDVEICCGGIVIKMSRAGHRTAVVDLTRGELGTRGDEVLRSQETANANKILGVTYRENLEFPDGGVEGHDTGRQRCAAESQLCKVIATIRKLRPEIMLVQYPKCRHPDHIAAGTLITRAAFFAGLPKFKLQDDDHAHFTPRQIIYYQMRYQFRPSFVLDISDVAEAKMEAIRCYASQLSLDEGSALKHGPNTLLSSPLTLGALDARARYFGSMIGVTHGEPFLTENALAIADPVRHFREVHAKPALIYPEYR